MNHFVLLLLLLECTASQLPPADRQATLTVALRDATNSAVAGARVELRDLDGQALTEARTNTRGECTLSSGQVLHLRVVVSGKLPDGTALRQRGVDREGVDLLLALGPNRLELRAEPDGDVIPDPAMMLADDRAAVPESIRVPDASPPATAQAAGRLPPWLMPLILVGCVACFLALQRRKKP